MLLASSSCVLDRAVISTFNSPINFNKAVLSSPLMESAFSILSSSSKIVLSNIAMLLFTSFQRIIQRTRNLSASAEVARRSRDDETQSAEHHQQIEHHPPNIRLDRGNPMMDVASQNHYIYNMGRGLRANV